MFPRSLIIHRSSVGLEKSQEGFSEALFTRVEWIGGSMSYDYWLMMASSILLSGDCFGSKGWYPVS
jgi:hypothetical protein